MKGKSYAALLKQAFLLGVRFALVHLQERGELSTDSDVRKLLFAEAKKFYDPKP